MGELFDTYDKTFGAVVQSSIDFSGLPHSFFTTAKADALRELIATRLHGMPNPHMLDVGCSVGTACRAQLAAHPIGRAVYRQWHRVGLGYSTPALALRLWTTVWTTANVIGMDALPTRQAIELSRRLLHALQRLCRPFAPV